jgi:hypothetical protein
MLTHDSSVDPIEFHNISTVSSLQPLANVYKIMGEDIGKAAELMRIRLNMAKAARQSYDRFINSIELE